MGRKTAKGARKRNEEDPDFELGGKRRGSGAAAAPPQEPGPAAAGALGAAGVVLPEDVMAQIAEAGIAGSELEHLLGADGQQIPALPLDEAQVQQLAAAGGIPLVGPEDLVAPLQPLAPPPRQFAAPEQLQLDAYKRADEQAMQAARRAGTMVKLTFTIELPDELSDVEMQTSTSAISVPQSCDVFQLKRYFMYQVHDRLVPDMQVLISEEGTEMEERDEAGNLIAISAYGVGDGSHITLRIVAPDDVDGMRFVDEAVVSSAYAVGVLQGRGGGRKTRWTTEQIEALVEGVERHGLSAWRTIVQDVRLAGKNNMQCKDKFRNLCLTIIQGRPERGLQLDWRLKDRVRQLIEQESIRF